MTTARQRAAIRGNAARSTGPRSGAGRHNSASNARRHGLEGHPSEEEVGAAFVTVLARLGRSAGNLSDAERDAAEHAHLVALEIEELPVPDTRAARDPRVAAILDTFRADGIAARLLKGLGGAAPRDAEALGQLLRYRSRAERAWRQALRQWASVTRQKGVPGPAVGDEAA